MFFYDTKLHKVAYHEFLALNKLICAAILRNHETSFCIIWETGQKPNRWNEGQYGNGRKGTHLQIPYN